MSDASVAEIARRLASAMVKRSHSRQPEDTRLVKNLQVELVSEVAAEMDAISRGMIGSTHTE